MCSLSPCQCRQNFPSARILIACMPSGIASGITCLLKAFAHALPPLALLTQKRDLRFRTLWAAGPLRSCAGCLSCSHQYCGLFSRSGSLAMLDAIRCASSRVRRFIAVLATQKVGSRSQKNIERNTALDGDVCNLRQPDLLIRRGACWNGHRVTGLKARHPLRPL
jgi:hypothetical protein